MRVEVERGQLTVFSFQFSVISFQLSVFSYRFSVIGCEISELLGRVILLGKPGKVGNVGRVGKPGNRGNFRKMLIYNIVVFRDCTAFVHYCTAFVVYCTALGRVVLPDGTARYFVTRAAPSPRALRGSCLLRHIYDMPFIEAVAITQWSVHLRCTLHNVFRTSPSLPTWHLVKTASERV